MEVNEHPVIYNGKKYIKTETDEEVMLTSLEKTYGKYTTLSFTKDQELSDRTKKTVADTIKKTIIRNYFENK